MAENLFKNNSSELMVQDYRTVVLNLNQFVPEQFDAIILYKNSAAIFSLGEDTGYLNFSTQFLTKDKTELVFVSSYKLIAIILAMVILVSFFISKYLNLYFIRAYSSRAEERIKLQRSEMLNELSKKVAHDIRSPLSTLNMLSTLIENQEIRELQVAVTAQIDQIANDLLSNARMENLVNSQPSLSVGELLLLLKKEYDLKSDSLQRRIVFSNYLQSNYSIDGSVMLYQNLNNFIINAVEASIVNGLIEVFAKTLDEGIAISVKDFGCGMDAQTLEKIGSAYFSTKSQPTGGQTGVIVSGNGLAMVNAKRTISENGWQLNVSSQLGVGTTITVFIPRVYLKQL